LAEQQAKADRENRQKIVITTNVPMEDADETFLNDIGETMYRRTVYGSRIAR
jgi:DNA replication protein DnaC